MDGNRPSCADQAARDSGLIRPHMPLREARSPAADGDDGDVDWTAGCVRQVLETRKQLGVAGHPDRSRRCHDEVAGCRVGPVGHRPGMVDRRHQPHADDAGLTPRPSRCPRRWRRRSGPVAAATRHWRLPSGSARRRADAERPARHGRGAGETAGLPPRRAHASSAGVVPRRRRIPLFTRRSGSAITRTPSMSRTTVEWPSQATPIRIAATRLSGSRAARMDATSPRLRVRPVSPSPGGARSSSSGEARKTARDDGAERSALFHSSTRARRQP